MSDLNETSYYEVALTNRQVVVAFVVLLTLVLAVFLCGVWVGQKGQTRMAHAGTIQDPESVESPELANMEEFKFFEEQQAQKEAELNKPDLGRLATKPRPETTLAQDVGASGAPAGGTASPPPPRPSQNPQSASPPPAAQQTRPAPPPPQQQTRPAPPPPKPAETQAPRATAPAQSAPPQAAPSSGESFVVQVFSTHDEPQAAKLQQRLQQLSYRAFLSTIAVGGQTMYRVRIGPYTDRDQAEKVKVDVRNKLKLDPWVTAASN